MSSSNQICVICFQEKNSRDPQPCKSEKHVYRKFSGLFYSEKTIKKGPCKLKYYNYLH